MLMYCENDHNVYKIYILSFTLDFNLFESKSYLFFL